jgi:protoheme IX farnesyltransferase
MLPAIEEDGSATGRRILLYSHGLIPISLAPTIFGMSGNVYAVGAIVMGIAYCYFGARLARLGLPMNAPRSKQRARQLLRASVIYLPLLFALMMINVVK